MSRGEVTVFVTGADRVTLDGSVVNKIGTLQIAIAAHTFGVPFVALVQAPDRQRADRPPTSNWRTATAARSCTASAGAPRRSG